MARTNRPSAPWAGDHAIRHHARTRPSVQRRIDRAQRPIGNERRDWLGIDDPDASSVYIDSARTEERK